MRRAGFLGDTGGDVDGVAKDVVAAANAVAGVDPNPKLHPVAFRQGLVEPQQTALDFNRRPHAVDRVRKIGHHRVADGLDEGALELGHCAGGQLRVALQHDDAGGVAVAVEVGGGAYHVGEEYGYGGLVRTRLWADCRLRFQQPVNVALFADHRPSRLLGYCVEHERIISALP